MYVYMYIFRILGRVLLHLLCYVIWNVKCNIYCEILRSQLPFHETYHMDRLADFEEFNITYYPYPSYYTSHIHFIFHVAYKTHISGRTRATTPLPSIPSVKEWHALWPLKTKVWVARFLVTLTHNGHSASQVAGLRETIFDIIIIIFDSFPQLFLLWCAKLPLLHTLTLAHSLSHTGIPTHTITQS